MPFLDDNRGFCFKLIKHVHRLPPSPALSPIASSQTENTQSHQRQDVVVPRPCVRKPLRQHLPTCHYLALEDSDMEGQTFAHRLVEEYTLRDGHTLMLCEICFSKKAAADIYSCQKTNTSNISTHKYNKSELEMFWLLECLTANHPPEESRANVYACVGSIWHPASMPGWVVVENRTNATRRLVPASDLDTTNQTVKRAFLQVMNVMDEDIEKTTVCATFEVLRATTA